MIRNFAGAFMIAALLFGATITLAATSPDEQLSDPVLEQRARVLGKELRCLVCQNQSIDDSDAELARDLRLLVREQLLAGKSDIDIKEYLVARYGEFVLLKPPFHPATYALWFGPFLILIMGGLLVWRARRQRDVRAAASFEADLTEQERSDLQRIMDVSEGRKP